MVWQYRRRLRTEQGVGPVRMLIVEDERSVATGVKRALTAEGHDVDIAPDWSEGFVSAIALDEGRGVLEAGCDPRGSKSECFPAFAYCW